MDITNRISLHFDQAAETLSLSAQSLETELSEAILALVECVSQGAKILACGNGGSAADAQHFIAELVGRFERERIPLAGIALNTDTSIMTAVGNDYGYDHIFERQVQALAGPEDILVAISTSGNSANVLKAIEAAHERDVRVIALSGKGGGQLNNILGPNDIHLCVPHERTMRIQEIHILLLHILCDGIDAFLLGDLA